MPKRKLTPTQIAVRERYEREISAIPHIPMITRRFLSFEGFVEYYLVMRDLYPSYEECYETLEFYYQEISGRRMYAEFPAFRLAIRNRKRKNTENKL